MLCLLTQKYIKQNSLDDSDNYFKYHYNDRKIINNISNNNNKSNQRNTNERNSNGVSISQHLLKIYLKMLIMLIIFKKILIVFLWLLI